MLLERGVNSLFDEEGAMGHGRAGLWIGVALTTGLAIAQQPTKGTVPRTVRVDVLVTTQSGEPVTDLNESDFSLWDNNVLRMKIMSFKVIRIGASRLPGMSYVSAELQSGKRREGLAYEITFDAAPAKEPNEYHSLGVKIDRPKLNVLARQGYYVQP